jgi:hypothetical protein
LCYLLTRELSVSLCVLSCAGFGDSSCTFDEGLWVRSLLSRTLLLFWQSSTRGTYITFDSSKQQEFESADRTVSERAVYPRLGVKESAGVVCIDCSWIYSFIHRYLLYFLLRTGCTRSLITKIKKAVSVMDLAPDRGTEQKLAFLTLLLF